MGNCSVGREMRFLVEMLLLEEFIQLFSEGEIRVGSKLIASGLPGKLHFTSNLTITTDNKCRPHS